MPVIYHHKVSVESDGLTFGDTEVCGVCLLSC